MKRFQRVTNISLHSRNLQLCPADKEPDCTEESLTTFEGLREVHNVPEDEKVPTLIAKLSGKA